MAKINAKTTGGGGIETVGDASGVLELQTAGTTAVTIDASQNVGIGTASPATKLHLYGATATALVERTVSDSAGYRAKTTLGDFTWGVGIATAANCWNVYDGTAATERMRINSVGEVTIGTADGGYKFHVRQDSGGIAYFRNAGGTGVLLTAGNSSWSSASDERIKDIIEPITNASEKVATLRAVIGKYKTDDDLTRRSFLIAQDVQKILPEAVTIQDDENKTLWLQYTETIPLLVAAIQEQQAIITDLKARIEVLENSNGID